MNDFRNALIDTLQYEGIYSNDVDDDGGETLCGISRVSYPNWVGWKLCDGMSKPIKVITPELSQLVKDFYLVQYWLPLKCHLISDDKIASELFDFAVNSGQVRAVRVLQSALNLLNNNGKLYNDIEEDGSIGPVTVSFANAHPEKEVLVKMMKVLRANFYINVAIKNPKKEKYVKGWFLRAIS